MTQGIFNTIQLKLKRNNAGMKGRPTVQLLQSTGFGNDNEPIADQAFDFCTQLGWGQKVPVISPETFESCELSLLNLGDCVQNFHSNERPNGTLLSEVQPLLNPSFIQRNAHEIANAPRSKEFFFHLESLASEPSSGRW